MPSFSEEITFSATPIASRLTVNGALRPARNSVNTALIGMPRGTYTQDCQNPTNPAFIAMVETADMGPFRVTGLRPAVRALRRIMDDIQAEQPAIHRVLGSAGMLCCRLVRGSSTSISNHAWGIAVDLTIEGRLDGYNDGLVQRGLVEIYPIFNRHGFYWGAAFPREDSMHFEASDQLVQKWARDGEFGTPASVPPRALTIGDRGPAVLALQMALNRALAPVEIDEDGIFGKDTRAAVLAFQAQRGLTPDGQGSGVVLEALGLK
ncbi:M15 family metallopeptidase [Fertoeibacter niger]|nr:M15 family metallopeptidase [Fertoeibacter niger]